MILIMARKILSQSIDSASKCASAADRADGK